MAQWVKNLPAMQETQETWVQSLGWEDPLEKKMATTPVFLPENPMGRETWQSTVHGVTKTDTTEQLSAGAFIYCPKRFSTVLPHLIFTRTTSDRYHYYFHFLDEEIEAMVQICIANK